MKIGYDAKRFYQNFTGLGNYSRTLIETLTTHFPEHQYHLFAPKLSDNQRVTSVSDHPSVKTHTPQGFWQSAKPLWRSYGIKGDLAASDIEIFHGLSHELPLSMPRNVRTVVTMHDLIHERFPEFYPFLDRKIYTYKFKKACERADVVVAISEQTKRDLIEFYGVEASKVRVIYQSCHRQFYLGQNNFSEINNVSTIDLNNYLSSENNYLKIENNYFESIKNKYKLPPQYLLYVGTVNERKNLLGLIRALQILDNQQGIKLVVIGDGGNYFKQVKKNIAENNLEKRVVLIPQIDFQDLPIIYKKARLFVLPSFFEGFGIPIIEALWSGTPVLTSTGSCFSEAGGAGALYVNQRDNAEIAHAIERLWFDETLRNDLILRGSDHVKKFHEKEIGRQWQGLYSGLIT